MKKDEARLLAGLCYVPVFFINIIAIIIVLVTGKGGKYGKFHAAQGILFFVALVVASVLLMLPFSIMEKFMPKGGFLGIPELLIGVAALLVSLYVAMMVFTGKEMRLPFIGEVAEKAVG